MNETTERCAGCGEFLDECGERVMNSERRKALEEEEAQDYALCLRDGIRRDWSAKNADIIERFSLSALRRIKIRAWQIVGVTRTSTTGMEHTPHRGNHLGYACGFSGPHCWGCNEPWPCRAERARISGEAGLDLAIEPLSALAARQGAGVGLLDEAIDPAEVASWPAEVQAAYQLGLTDGKASESARADHEVRAHALTSAMAMGLSAQESVGAGLDVELLRQARRNIERRNDRAFAFDRDIDTLAAEYARLAAARLPDEP